MEPQDPLKVLSDTGIEHELITGGGYAKILEAMMTFARSYSEAWCKEHGLPEPTEEQIKVFQQKYYDQWIRVSSVIKK